MEPQFTKEEHGSTPEGEAIVVRVYTCPLRNPKMVVYLGGARHQGFNSRRMLDLRVGRLQRGE